MFQIGRKDVKLSEAKKEKRRELRQELGLFSWGVEWENGLEKSLGIEKEKMSAKWKEIGTANYWDGLREPERDKTKEEGLEMTKVHRLVSQTEKMSGYAKE